MATEEIIYIDGFEHISYTSDFLDEEGMLTASKEFYKWLNKRRSV